MARLLKFAMAGSNTKTKPLKRAEQLRRIAEDVRGKDARKILLEIARDYERTVRAGPRKSK